MGNHDEFGVGRTIIFFVLFAFAFGFTVYMLINVPVEIPVYPRSEALKYWPLALICAVFVAVVDVAVLFATRYRYRRLLNRSTRRAGEV
jgi:membrane protein implicated in regulation of membrane protease activity